MATIVGVVSQVQGTVLIKLAAGSVKELAVGDVIYSDAVLQGVDAQQVAQIDLSNGEEINLDPGEQWLFDENAAQGIASAPLDAIEFETFNSEQNERAPRERGFKEAVTNRESSSDSLDSSAISSKDQSDEANFEEEPLREGHSTFPVPRTKAQADESELRFQSVKEIDPSVSLVPLSQKADLVSQLELAAESLSNDFSELAFNSSFAAFQVAFANFIGRGFPPSLTELTGLGVTGLNSNNIRGVQNNITNKAQSIETLEDLQQVSDEAINAQQVITQAAENNNASSQTIDLENYVILGVNNLGETNQDAFNSILNSGPVTAQSIQTVDLIQQVISNYNAIQILADSIDNNPLTLSANQYQSLGLSNINTAQEATLMTDVIDQKSLPEVNSYSKLLALSEALQSVFDNAANSGEVSIDELSLLGLDNLSNANMPAIVQAITVQPDDGSTVSSLASLQSIIDQAISAREDAQQRIVDAAQNNTADDNLPSEQDYSVLGVKGITSANLAAITSVLNTQLIAGAQVDTVQEIQLIVDAYQKILAAADNQADNDPKLSQAEYLQIGLEGVDSVVKQALLGDVIDAKRVSQVDSVAELSELLAAVNAVAESSATNLISIAELETLEITGVTEENIAIAQQVVNDNASSIQSLSALQSLIDAAINGDDSALRQLQEAALNSSATATTPSADIYLQAGISGVNEGNLAAINSSLNLASVAQTANASQIQLRVNSYQLLLNSADGNADGDTGLSLQGYQNIGVTGVDSDVEQRLLASVFDIKNTPAVDSIVEVQAIADAAQGVMDAAAGSNALPTKAQLDVLGITGVTAANLAVIQQGLQDTADDGSEVDTLAKLQALVDSAVSSIDEAAVALQKIVEAAQANDAANILLADYVDAGVTAIDSSSVISLNSVLEVTAIGGTDVDSLAELQAIADSFKNIIAATSDSNQVLNNADFARIGVTGVSIDNLAAVQAQILASSTANTDTVSEVQDKVNAANAALQKIENYNNGTGTTPPALSVQDYINAGIKGVNAAKLAAMNALVLAESVGGADTVGEIQSLADSIAAGVISVALTSASGVENNRLNTGDVLSITVQMDQTVIVTGNPQLALNIGGSSYQADYVSGSNSQNLVFQYTIANQNDPDGISIDANSLALNGGSILDSNGNTATLTHSAVGDNSLFLVDNTVPASITSINIPEAVDGINSTEMLDGTLVTVTIPATVVAGEVVKLNIAKQGGATETVSHTVLAAEIGTTANITVAANKFPTDGKYNISATITDQAGNEGLASAITVVYVDRLAASAPTNFTATDNVGVTGTIFEGGVTDDPQPSLSGTVEPLAKVRIFDNGVFVKQVTALADGSWSYTFENPLSYQAHAITISQTDAAGNAESSQSSALNFTVDATINAVENEAFVFASAHFPATPETGLGLIKDIKFTQLSSDGKLQFDNGAGWQDVAEDEVLTLTSIGEGKLRFVPDTDETGFNDYHQAGVGNAKNDYAHIKYQYSDGTNLGVIKTLVIDVQPRDTDGDGIVNTLDVDDDNDGILDKDENSTVTSGTAFDVTSATLDTIHEYEGGVKGVRGMTFSADGTKLFVVEVDQIRVIEYELTEPYELAGKVERANFGLEVDWNPANAKRPYGISFNSDGSKMFIAGDFKDTIIEYSLASNFDISSITVPVAADVPSNPKTYSIASEGNEPQDILFSSDGLKMFVIDSQDNEINEYTLTGAYDVSTKQASVNTFSVQAQVNGVSGMGFNNDGSLMYVVGSGGRVNIYKLENPYSMQGSIQHQGDFSVGEEGVSAFSIAFNDVGSKMYIADNESIAVYDIGNGVASNDIDGDGIINSLDLDSDNDGITDNVEAQTTQGFIAALGVDANNDGLDDAYTSGLTAIDSDSDGVVDYMDLDSDNDNIADIVERDKTGANYITSMSDTDGDGLLDIFEATNVNDGFNSHDENVNLAGDKSVLSYNLSDSNNNILANGSDANGTQNLDYREADVLGLDTDGDGVLDINDLDDDNDGILDSVENASAIGDNAYKALSATYSHRYYIGEQETDAKGMKFSSDGTKLFIVGTNGDEVNEYQLQSPYNLAAKVLLNTLHLEDKEETIEEVSFSHDGTKMFVMGFEGDDVNVYNLASAYDTKTVTGHIEVALDAAAANPTGMTFSSDGMKMFVIGSTNKTIYEYSLGSAYDVTTITTPASATFNVGGDILQPSGLAFNHDGSALYITNSSAKSVHEYQLDTNFTLTGTMAHQGSIIVSGEDKRPHDIAFNSDGTQMFVLGFSDDNILVYDIDSGTVANDIDGDGIINSLDLDSDNDGIADNIEAQTLAGYQSPGVSFVDSDGDGLNDVYDQNIGSTSGADSKGLTVEDSDSDGLSDYLDTNSDNDNKSDTVESGIASTSDASYADVNGSIDSPAVDLEVTVAEFDFRNSSITPLILDLDGDGVETIALSHGVIFDIDADGTQDKTGWVGADDGLLVWDKNRNGQIDDASELFGEFSIKADGTRARNGFEALIDLDVNGDQVFDHRDEAYDQLQLWQDINSDGKSQANEFSRLAEAGVESIDLAVRQVDEQHNGNWSGLRASWNDSNGREQAIDDVWFRYQSGRSELTNDSSASIQVTPSDLTDNLLSEEELVIDFSLIQQIATHETEQLKEQELNVNQRQTIAVQDILEETDTELDQLFANLEPHLSDTECLQYSTAMENSASDLQSAKYSEQGLFYGGSEELARLTQELNSLSSIDVD